MKRRFAIALATASAVLCVISSHAADLDAPVTPPAPTVGSELYRGASAGSECSQRVRADALLLSRCLHATHEGNIQKQTRTDPFSLGLFFDGWLSSAIITSLRKDAESESVTKGMFDIVKLYQAKLNMELEDICRGTKRSCERVLPRWTEWSERAGPLR